MSATRPTRGLAVTPLKASEPPHFTPTTRSETRGRACGWSCSAMSTSSSTAARPGLHLVFRGLGGEGPQACRVDMRRRRQHARQLVVLAAQPQDQGPAGVGMRRQGSDHGPRGDQVTTDLRAAEGVGQRIDPVDAALELPVGGRRDLLGGAGDAADGAEDPDLVARADPAVGAAVALEGRVRWRGQGLGRRRIVGVGLEPREIGRHVVTVHVLARRDVGGRVADGPAVFQHRLAGRDGPQRDLVTGGNVGGGDDGVGHRIAGAHRRQGDDHVVARVYGEELDAGHEAMVTGVRACAKSHEPCGHLGLYPVTRPRL